MTNTFLKKQTKGKIMNNAQELKAHLQDSNKARIYEERYKKWRKKKTNEMYEEKKKQITITFYLYDSSITITDTTIQNAYKLFLKKYSNFYNELHEVVIAENGEDLNPYTGDAFKKEYKYLEGINE